MHTPLQARRPAALHRLLCRLFAALGLSLALLACGTAPHETPRPAPAETPATTPPSTPQPTTLPAPAPQAAPVTTGPAARRDEASREHVRDRSLKVAPLAGMAVSMPAMPYIEAPLEDRERYGQIKDNPVRLAAESPVSTFSIDVDTGSYSNVRRFLNQGRLPPTDAVRVEELINYFPYDYAQPTDAHPFAVHTELAAAPWNADRLLMRIGIKGRDVASQRLPAANLVFLVDVSGSMNSPDKLPLLKSSLKLLVNEMAKRGGGASAADRITLVTYSGHTAVTLPPTPLSEHARILAAIDALNAHGSTNGASGIALAYQMAQQGFIRGGINRILLATDGDFNVGISDFGQLKAMVEERRKSGVSLSTLGFGTGNYNEQLMEQLADAGDGAYSYIDNLMEGHKVLVSEMSSTLATIAQDVKVQVEFNPATVQEYRLIGYENRTLAREDFNNDQVDAGDIGAGHTVTALYEITLKGGRGLVDPLRYAASLEAARHSEELAHVKLRYKLPGEKASTLIERTVSRAAERPIIEAGSEFRFATAVAGFGQLLRGGKYTGQWKFSDARALAASATGADRFGYRGEFLRLVELAGSLATRPVAQRQE